MENPGIGYVSSYGRIGTLSYGLWSICGLIAINGKIMGTYDYMGDSPHIPSGKWLSYK